MIFLFLIKFINEKLINQSCWIGRSGVHFLPLTKIGISQPYITEISQPGGGYLAGTAASKGGAEIPKG